MDGTHNYIHLRGEVEHQQKTIPSRSLYISHSISTWNSRGFEFGAILFLADIFPGTLLAMSIYALVRAAAAIAFSPRVGRCIDEQERLSTVRLSIIGQRIAVVVSCLGFLFLLFATPTRHIVIDNIVFGSLILLACVEKLCSIMNLVAVERDWTVVIADGDESLLQEMNSQMRRIDLFCKLVAPLGIALLNGISTKIAVSTTFAMNLCSIPIEYLFIAHVYHQTPALIREADSTALIDESERMPQRTTSIMNYIKAMLHQIRGSLKVYISSTAFLPSLSLSMLYFTVLSFSGPMITFLLAARSLNITSTGIGVLRTVATAAEISATFVAPRIMTRIGPVRAGIWFLSWQLLCLASGVGMLWLPQANYSSVGIIVFVVMVILSRVGLWSFDLVAQLLIQNSIDQSGRGSFSSTEASLQNFFELCTFTMTIIFSKPEQFKIPALVSSMWTVGAAVLYAKFVRDTRGHLLHLRDCLQIRRRKAHYNSDQFELS